MLTGDKAASANIIAKEVGISDVRAELFPEDKLAAVKNASKEEAPEQPWWDRLIQKLTGESITRPITMMVGDGVNDSPEQAELLARRVKPLAAHVNLIPLNHVDERSFEPSKPENLKRFVNILTKNGVNTTIRRRLGSDVDASCGQLRRKMTREAK